MAAVPTRRILIVDDSPEDRETWRRYLANDPMCHYDPIESDCLEAALEACRTERPDCILLDYHLPDGNGIEFLHDLRHLGGTTAFPTVVLTATGNEAVAVNAMKAGAQDYLIKHRLDPEALHRALNGAVYKAETERLLAWQRTELEDAYRLAQEANAHKDQFLAVLSHELRAPLTPILAAVSSVEAGEASTQELTAIFDLIRRNVELEARLIDDLLDITRISHGKLELHSQSVDVHELIRHALDICQPVARAKEITIEADLSAPGSRSQADPARLQQVFWNLLNNAIKFTPPGGSVRIATRNPATNRLEVDVQDTGMGIAPDNLGQVFNAFEQGDTQVARRFGGLGLGLAICKALVEAHGGRITVESPGSNQGATFRVALTAESGVPAPATAPAPVAPTGSPQALTGIGRCILLVEDHADSALMLSVLMRRRGYEVLHASTVAEAQALFQGSGPVDIVVSDLGLPDGNGADLIRSLRAMRPVPSIVLSGYGEADTLAESLEAGAQEHLIKPVMWPQLDAALSRLLAPPVA